MPRIKRFRICAGYHKFLVISFNQKLRTRYAEERERESLRYESYTARQHTALIVSTAGRRISKKMRVEAANKEQRSACTRGREKYESIVECTGNSVKRTREKMVLLL